MHRPRPTAPPKSAGVAIILSLLICGAGHLYTSNPFWALFWFCSAVLSGVLTVVLVGWVLLPIVWIGACVHAGICAGLWNGRHHAVR